MTSFDDEDYDDAEMNSSCAAVSQILLSLKDALPSSAHSKLSLPVQAAVHCDNVLRNYDSQSTVDVGNPDDDRFFSSRSAAADDHDRQVTDNTQINDMDCCDDTQYVEHCCGGGAGLNHSYAPVDHTENGVVTLSADNSPSLLDTTQLLQFISSTSGNNMQPVTAALMNAVPDDALMHIDDVEPHAQVTQDVCDADVETFSVPALCGMNDIDDDQRCGSAGGTHVTIHSSAESSLSSNDIQHVEILDDGCVSLSALSDHTGGISPSADASCQVDICLLVYLPYGTT